MNKEMILKNGELVRTNINRIICRNQNWAKNVKYNLTEFLNDVVLDDDIIDALHQTHVDDGETIISIINLSYHEFMNYLYDDLSQHNFAELGVDAQKLLLKFGLPQLSDGEYKFYARDYEIVTNLIKNFSDNLIIQYCVFLLLKKQYNVERAKTSTMNGFILGL